MRLPAVTQKNKNVSYIDTFGGINKRYRIAENEFNDSLNMCSDDYPVLSSRNDRQTFRKLFDDIVSMCFVNDKLVVLSSDGYIRYGDKSLQLDNTDETSKLIPIGRQIYLHPQGYIISLPTTDEGSITAEEIKQGYTIRKGFISVDEGELLGDAYFYPATEDTVGKYIYDDETSSEASVGEYRYHQDSETGVISLQILAETDDWDTVQPTLINVVIAVVNRDFKIDKFDKFKTNDAIKVTAGLTAVQSDNTLDIDSYYTIYDITYDEDNTSHIYLRGVIEDAYEIDDTLDLIKPFPVLDFVFEHNARLWGCRYGINDDGQFINEIYASASGDITNWYRYNGTAADSYTISVTSDGAFTGAGVVGGYPTFFKENVMHRIYGDYPSNFQMFTQNIAGVQTGCGKSFATANGVTYYKSPIGIMAMSDGLPVKISENLGIDDYSGAVGGTDGIKYYVSMMDDILQERRLYVYDIQTRIWHTEDISDEVIEIVNYKNVLFATVSTTFDKQTYYDSVRDYYDKLIAAESNPLVKAMLLIKKTAALANINAHDGNNCIEFVLLNERYARNVELPDFVTDDYDMLREGDIEWSCETGEIGYSTYDMKAVSKVVVRASVDYNARLDVAIRYDSENEWTSIRCIKGNQNTNSYNIPVIPTRCDHFSLRFSGMNGVKIIGLTKFFEEGSEISGY